MCCLLRRGGFLIHLPRGTSLLHPCSQPLVHVGFMKTWLAGNLNLKLIDRIMEIVQSWKAEHDPSQAPKIYITGKPFACAMTHAFGDSAHAFQVTHCSNASQSTSCSGWCIATSVLHMCSHLYSAKPPSLPHILRLLRLDSALTQSFISCNTLQSGFGARCGSSDILA